MNRFARLVNVIHNQLEAHGLDNFRGILFVQQRITTHILKNLLDRIPSLSTNLRTACIYATAGEATPLLKVTQTQSKERVGQFAKGAVNLLICTAGMNINNIPLMILIKMKLPKREWMCQLQTVSFALIQFKHRYHLFK